MRSSSLRRTAFGLNLARPEDAEGAGVVLGVPEGVALAAGAVGPGVAVSDREAACVGLASAC